MTQTPGAFARMSAVVFAAVLFQVSGMTQITILGATPDLIPLAVAAVALYAGSIPGASAGFATGLMLDVTVGEHLGASSLVLTAVGYWVGRYREIRDPAHGLMPIPVAAAATAGYLAGSAAVNFMLSIDATVSPLVLRDALLVTLYGALLALPVFAAVRWVLRPALLVDPLERRRRRRPPAESGPLGLRGLGLGGR